MAESRISREDVESAVGARRELGDDLEPAVVHAFVSLGAGIPITAIAAEGGVGLAWLGIVGVNAAQRLGRD